MVQSGCWACTCTAADMRPVMMPLMRTVERRTILGGLEMPAVFMVLVVLKPLGLRLVSEWRVITGR